MSRVSHIWFGLSGDGTSHLLVLSSSMFKYRLVDPAVPAMGRAAARLSAEHSDGLLACRHDVLARMDFLLLRLRRGSSQACTVGMRRRKQSVFN